MICVTNVAPLLTSSLRRVSCRNSSIALLGIKRMFLDSSSCEKNEWLKYLQLKIMPLKKAKLQNYAQLKNIRKKSKTWTSCKTAFVLLVEEAAFFASQTLSFCHNDLFRLKKSVRNSLESFANSWLHFARRSRRLLGKKWPKTLVVLLHITHNTRGNAFQRIGLKQISWLSFS